jgi:hypothetical protein
MPKRKPEVVIPTRPRPTKSAEEEEEFVHRAKEIAKSQGSGKAPARKRGPDSGVTCQRCAAGGLECTKTGGPRQKSCDACVKAKHACLAPGEKKPERKRAKKESAEEAEEGPGAGLKEFLGDVVKELKALKREVGGVRAAMDRVAGAVEWVADHYEDEEEEVESGEEEEAAAEVQELRAEVAEVAGVGESMTLQ